MTKTCSTQDAAERLGVSHRTVQLWVESGHLQAWKTVGGHRRILISSLEDFLNSRYSAVLCNATPKENQHRISLAHKVVFVCDGDENMRGLIQKYAYGLNGVKWKFFKSNLEALLEISEGKPNIFISEICVSGMDVRHMITTLSTNPISCLDSWDHVPIRSWPLFKARKVLRTLFQFDLSPAIQ